MNNRLRSIILILCSLPLTIWGLPLRADVKNPFFQPAPTTDFYGSGDINADGNFNTTDLNQLQAMIGQSNIWNYRGDINGDQKIDNADFQLFTSLLNKSISYLPSWWNCLQTRSEREDWVKKLAAIFDTHYKQFWSIDNPCGAFASQWFQTGSFDRSVHHFDENMNSMGRTLFNIPVFLYSGCRTFDNMGHAMAAILVGTNPLLRSDWMIIDRAAEGTSYFTTIPLHCEGILENMISFPVNSPTANLQNSNFLTIRPTSTPPLPPIVVDNDFDISNPRLLPYATKQLIFEKRRTENDLSGIYDLHLADIGQTNGPLTTALRACPDAPAFLRDVKQIPNSNDYDIIFASKPPLTAGGANKTPGVFYGCLKPSSALTAICRLSGTSNPVFAPDARIISLENGTKMAFWASTMSNLSKIPDGIYFNTYTNGSWNASPALFIPDFSEQNSVISPDYSYDVDNLSTNQLIFAYVPLTSQEPKPLYYKLFSNNTWTDPGIIDNNVWQVDIASKAGVVHAVYVKTLPGSDISSRQFCLIHSIYRDGTWSTPVQIDMCSNSDVLSSYWPLIRYHPLNPMNPRIKILSNNKAVLLFEKSVITGYNSPNDYNKNKRFLMLNTYSDNWSPSVPIAEMNDISPDISFPSIEEMPDGRLRYAWQYTTNEIVTARTGRILSIPTDFSNIRQAASNAQPFDIVYMEKNYAEILNADLNLSVNNVAIQLSPLFNRNGYNVTTSGINSSFIGLYPYKGSVDWLGIPNSGVVYSTDPYLERGIREARSNESVLIHSGTYTSTKALVNPNPNVTISFEQNASVFIRFGTGANGFWSSSAGPLNTTIPAGCKVEFVSKQPMIMKANFNINYGSYVHIVAE